MKRVKPPRRDKVQNVDELRKIFLSSQCCIMTEYRGIKVSEVTELRNRLRPGGGEYHVVKNTLFRRAIGDSLTPELEKTLSGPMAIAFATKDPVDTSKVLLAFLRELKKPDIKVTAAYMGGKIFTPEQVTALSKTPPREVVLAQALGTMQAPLTNFAGTMQGVLSEFARTLQALADKRQAEGA